MTDETTVGEHEGVLDIMGPGGDTKVKWDRRVAAEVEVARRTFDDLVAKGYAAFKVTRLGGRGERTREFDPNVEEIILVPQIAGG